MSGAKPVVLAFLQNMWLKDPPRARALIARHGEAYRLRLQAMALFRRCVTGRRLRAAFGDDLCDGGIVWEESSLEITDNPRIVVAADPGHMTRAIETHRPLVVVTFGKVAAGGLGPFWTGHRVTLPHPAARQADVMDRLRAGAARIRELVGG